MQLWVPTLPVLCQLSTDFAEPLPKSVKRQLVMAMVVCQYDFAGNSVEQPIFANHPVIKYVIAELACLLLMQTCTCSAVLVFVNNSKNL